MVPGGQALASPLIAIGKGTQTAGDFLDIGADLLEHKDKDVLIKTSISLASTATGDAINKLPITKMAKDATDTYIGKGIGFMKDGYFDNRQVNVEESDKLDIKIETKQIPKKN